MALKVSQTEVWVGNIQDRPGGLNEKLVALAEGGVNLEFIIARRAPDQPGKGVVFLTPIKGARQAKAAAAAGFRKTGSLHSVRIEGADKPGLGARITEALSGSGINLRGLSAAALGRKFVAYLALDTAAAAAKAVAILRRLR